jgi:ribose transport system substrate-binding protein
MRQKRWVVAIFMMLFAVALIPASGNKEATQQSAKTGVRIGFSMSTLNNVFFVGMRMGVTDAAKKAGVTLLETNADGDITKQASQMEDLIQQKVDAIICNPVDSDAIVASEKKAAAAGIPVIYCDRGSTGKDYACFIETDNIAMGELGAKSIVDFLTKKYGEPKGNVVEIQGLIGTSAARDRGQGFNNAIAKYPNIKIVARQAGDFNQEKSLNVMQNIIQANPKIDAVYGHNDDCTLGALKAIEGAALLKPVGQPDHIYIIGIDGTFDAITAIKAGKMDATISQAPIIMGGKAVGLAIDVVNKKPVEKHIYNPFYVIDIKNADDPNNWGTAVK